MSPSVSPTRTRSPSIYAAHGCIARSIIRRSRSPGGLIKPGLPPVPINQHDLPPALRDAAVGMPNVITVRCPRSGRKRPVPLSHHCGDGGQTTEEFLLLLQPAPMQLAKSALRSASQRRTPQARPSPGRSGGVLRLGRILGKPNSTRRAPHPSSARSKAAAMPSFWLAGVSFPLRHLSRRRAGARQGGDFVVPSGLRGDSQARRTHRLLPRRCCKA